MRGREGKIYILRNPYLKDAVVKIGRTSRISEQRAKEISGSTGVPYEFEVLFEEDVLDSHMAEKIIHKKLNVERVNPKREFFKLPLKKAVKVVFETCLEVNKDSLRGASSKLLIVIKGSCRKNPNLVQEIAENLSGHKGCEIGVYIFWDGKNANALLKTDDEWNVCLSPELINKLKRINDVSYVLWTTADLKRLEESLNSDEGT